MLNLLSGSAVVAISVVVISAVAMLVVVGAGTQVGQQSPSSCKTIYINECPPTKFFRFDLQESRH